MTGRDRMVLMGIIVLVVIAAGWMLVVSPERKKADSLQTQVTTAQSSLSTAEGQLNEARAAQKQYASAYSSVVNLGKAVPAGQEVPSLIYELAQASDHKDVNFTSIASAAPSPGSATPAASSASADAAFTAMPFTFVFDGGFFDLEHLFKQLTGFTTHGSHDTLNVSGRLLTIQGVKLTPDATGKTLTGTITASAYVLPASQSVTQGASPTSPTGASTPASTTAASASPAPAVVKVTP
jgi:hypothetical protein